MLWVLIGTVSLRHFQWAPQQIIRNLATFFGLKKAKKKTTFFGGYKLGVI